MIQSATGVAFNTIVSTPKREIQMLNRRELLKRSALLSLSPVLPAFLSRTALAAGAEQDRRILLVIQLDGGNDGLNTVVPRRDEHYKKLRPKLHIEASHSIKLNDEIGLHPSMKAAGKLFDAGRFTVVQGVGYPNPNRSHFVSMNIWQSARLDEAEHGQYGWLGRAMDIDAAPETSPQDIFVGSGSAPVALWGRRSTTASVASLDDLTLTTPTTLLQSAAARPSGELARWAADASQNAFSTVQRLSALASHETTAQSSKYPDSQLAQQLQVVANLIRSGSSARVFYTVQGGYDTHAAQLDQHSGLLRNLSDGLKAFVDDLTADGLAERVLVLAFSEFGRRSAENDSEGTDHGAAAPVFLAGPKLAAGIVGPAPNLGDLQDGDVRVAIDFRQVYATILSQWLDVSPGEILKGDFAPLRLLNT
jgi:uncharacterized protein (DUF1501 family)